MIIRKREEGRKEMRRGCEKDEKREVRKRKYTNEKNKARREGENKMR
jgi:hypothetical protein